MLIDWFTVGAQAVNFLALVWLMQRFLYKPILQAISGREKRIAEELAAAANDKTAAQAERLMLAAKNTAFDTERAATLAVAVAAAAAEHDRLLAKALTDDEASKLRQQTLLQGAQIAQGERLKSLITAEVFAIARRALAELAGADLEERMVGTLMSRLAQMTPAAKQPWIAAARKGAVAGFVRTRFDLGPPLRTALQKAVDDACGAGIILRFEAATDSLGGIEISIAGQQLAWSINGYVGSLQTQVAAMRDGVTGPAAVVANLSLALAS